MVDYLIYGSLVAYFNVFFLLFAIVEAINLEVLEFGGDSMTIKIGFKKRVLKSLLSFGLAFATAVPSISSPVVVYANDDTDFSSSYESDDGDDSGQTLDEMDMIDTSSSSSGSDSGGGGTKLSGSMESRLLNYLSSKMNTDTTHLDNLNVTSDIDVDLQANPENYRWTAFYRKNKDDDLDTSSKNSDGTYHGFSASKVKAWYQYVDHIKSYNDGKAPEIKDYKYPLTTKSDQLDFWADKPGVYDVYGDPYYSKVVLTAGVDVELLESKKEYVDIDDTLSQAGGDQGLGDNGNGGDGGGGMSDIGFNDICSTTVFPQMKNAVKAVKKKGGKAWKKGSNYDKTLNSLYKSLKAMGAIKMKKSTFKSKVKQCVDANLGANNDKSKNKKSSNKSPNVNGLTVVDLSTDFGNYKGDVFKKSNKRGKVVINKDAMDQFQKDIKKNNQSVKKKQKNEMKIGSFSSVNLNKAESGSGSKTSTSKSKKQYQEQISSNIDITNKEEDGTDFPSDTTGKVKACRTIQERVSKHITIAQCVVNDIYGSQLERVGEVAVGDPTNTWSMDEDDFWTEDPNYYTQQDTGYISVENKSSGDALSTSTYTADEDGSLKEDTDSEDTAPDEALIFGFVRTKDSDYIGGETAFSDLTVQQKNLVHGYNTVPGHPEDKIDASLDENNAGSKYAGQVPLVNFHLSADDETQRTKKSAKKHVILTQDDSTGENTIGTTQKEENTDSKSN